MRKTISLLLIVLVAALSSCRKDFDTVPSNGTLEFSKQTVYLDTVFSNIGSSTYMLKVYNRGSNDISIPAIHLAKGAASKYRLMVDGMTGDNGNGKYFSNVELLAKDSLFVFIEVTATAAEANATDFLYTDEIVFDAAGPAQQVNLVTLIQDAVFLYPRKLADGFKETLNIGMDGDGNAVEVDGFELSEADPVNGDELHFTNQKPYVIYGFAGVPSGKTLVIDPGARVHFHAESGLIVKEGGSININGAAPTDFTNNPLQNEVIFEGDRLEPDFSDVPGQWGTVWLMPGSINNTINHLTLKNAVVGLLVDSALEIGNSQIYNSSNWGILARAAAISGDNLVINLAGQATLGCTIGGSYRFRHCTFNNNWASPNQLSVLVSNYTEYADGSRDENDLVQADFFNCIIYGYNRVQLFLDKSDNKLFNTNFNHCLVKFNDEGTGVAGNPLYDQIRNEAPITTGEGNFRNEAPGFYNQNNNQLNISPDGFAAGKANYEDPYFVPNDILGLPRAATSTDIGAYKARPFPE